MSGTGGSSPESVETPTDGKGGAASAALVLGIASIPTAVALAPLGLLLGLVAVALGLIGRSRFRRGVATNGGAAFAGTLTGAVGTVLAIVYLALVASFVYHHRSSIASFDRCLRRSTTAAQVTACRQEARVPSAIRTSRHPLSG